MSIDNCRETRSASQDMVLQIQRWEKAQDGRLLIMASGDYKGESVGLEAYFKMDMKPVEYNPVTGVINIVDPETVYVDGITLKSIGTESDQLIKAFSDMYEITLPNYKMASELNFTVLCLENENNDMDEFSQKYQLLIDEEEGKDSYGEFFMNVDVDLGALIISESNVEYRKNILGALTGAGTSLSFKIKEVANGVGNYFNNIANKMKMAKLNMKLTALARNSIRIISIPAEEDKIGLGKSKFGGRPDLPIDFHWPEWKGMSLSFIAQINLAEVGKYDTENYLPKSGIMYFFYDAADQTVWGFDPDDKDSSRIVFADMKEEDLKRWDFPEDLPEDFRYDSGALKFSSESTIPSIDSVFVDDLELIESELETFVNMVEANANAVEDCSINRLLGYPDIISGEMETLCSLVSHGEYCGGIIEIEEEKVDFYLKDAKEWQLLLQIDSLDKLGFMWGDGGKLYYWIRKCDLAKKDFTKIWLVKQSN